MRDPVSKNSKKNKNVKNVMIPMHVDPIWNCHLGKLLIWSPEDCIKSGSTISATITAQAHPNNAISSVVGV